MSDTPKSESSHYDLRSAKFGGGFTGTEGNQVGGAFHDHSSNYNQEGTIWNLFFGQQPVPKLRQNMTYSQARNLLIQEGWQAVFNTSQVNNPHRGAVIDNLIEKGYTEVVDCSGTELGLCMFEFQNATGQTLFVTTANNDPELESIVFGWRLE